MNSLLVKEYFSKLADKWDDNSASDTFKLSKIADCCDIMPGQRVIDVACGTGIMFPYLLAKEPQFLLGVDICFAMVNKARSKFSDSRLKVIAQDFFTLNQKEFDCAVCYNAYPHFLNKAEFAKKVRYVLKEGGRFIIAHGLGREDINSVHKERAAFISTTLNSADTEKKWFEPYFCIDIIIDTDDVYIISGIKK